MVHDLETLRRLNAEATESNRAVLKPQELADIIERRMKFEIAMSEYERGYNAAVTTVVAMLRELSR